MFHAASNCPNLALFPHLQMEGASQLGFEG